MNTPTRISSADSRRVASHFHSSLRSNYADLSAPVLCGPGRAPRARRPYEPKMIAPGAIIDLPEYGACQVWSDGDLPRSRWAIPTSDQSHLERRTLAVLVQEQDGELTVKNTTTRDYPTATAA